MSEVRRTEFYLGRNSWGEPKVLVRYELRCPDCGTWNPLTLQAQHGQELLVCRQLGCDFKTQHDFTPFVTAIERKRIQDQGTHA